APDPSLHWSVGDQIQLVGTGTDAEDGPLTGSKLAWTVDVEHCPAGEGCHLHPLTSFTGDSKTISAPDHEYLSRLLIQLTATDSGGLSDTAVLRLDPATHTVSLDSDPEGIDIGLGTVSGPAPRTQTVISGS